MSRTVLTETRSQQALQSYLDGLLQDAAIELADSVSQDEFQAAVLEEQLRDARISQPPRLEIVQPTPPAPPVVVAPEAPEIPASAPVHAAAPIIALAAAAQPVDEPTAIVADRHPGWGDEPFECLLFDVAGLTLAVPLVCLGSIYPLAGQELTPLFGQPDWFLGILPSQAGNLKVLDTARWVMPDRYRDDFRQGLQYVISVQGYEWGLAVHQVSRSIRLDPSEVKWRTQRSQRPWLAGTVIEHMCALVDVTALAELIASGAVKQMQDAAKPHKR
ncbi:CheW domain-containing protein [Stutzerimonas frequens]|jgi:purine-binding chemotaxis protein CheW|uniref:CheW domain-containing protein n=1 Tax=Stutzerimonas frequens TaxID=2968969 RepID=UPI002934333D|nr:CheW domain-containing protein [Stutzerimonas frequens]WOC78362.1 CheW domain-containing protein [Stutzerimonas frequens]